eukprot:gene9085-16739_t
MSRSGKVTPGHSTASDVELRDLGVEDEMEMDNPDAQMFGDLPSRLASRSAMSFHHKAASRRSLRGKLSNTGESAVALPVDRVESQLEMLDLEDSTNDPLAESRNLDKIKAAPISLAQKKSIKNLHERETQRKKRNLSCWKSFKLKIGMSWALMKMRLNEFFGSLELWRGPLKEVEGEFGNGVLSYFLFLKSLLLLNVIIFVLVFSFLTVPQILKEGNTLKESNETVSTTSPNVTLPSNGSSFSPLTGGTCSVPLYNSSGKSVQDHIVDFITGQGYISSTLMFYGTYSNQTLQNTDIKYDMPLAYMLVGISYLIVSLIIMVHNFSTGFTESVIESGGLFYSYCNKIFASWDYCITSEKAAVLKKKNVFQDLQAELAEEKRREKVQSRTRAQKCKIYTIRGVINLLIMGFLAGSVYAIIKTVEISEQAVASGEADQSDFNAVMKKWASSLTITALNLVLPLIFEYLTEMEDWSPRLEVALVLWRSVLLKLASVTVLVITLYTTASYRTQCWENSIGAQMYNLIWIDLFVVVFITIFAETSRKYVSLYLNCGCNLGEKIGQQEFQIPKNVLDLVYGQALIWIGTFFAPLIPAIGVLKLILVFYVKKISLMFNCKPASKPYQGSRNNYFFTLLLLLTFLLCVLGVGWGLTRNFLCLSDKKMFDIISLRIKDWPTVLSEIMNFVETPAFLVPVLIIICLLLYYFRSMTTAHERMIEMLKDQLVMEGRDKRFLMERLLTLTKKTDDASQNHTLLPSMGNKY